MAEERDLAEDCREKFLQFCRAREITSFHSLKSKWADMAWEQVDIYLDLRDIESL